MSTSFHRSVLPGFGTRGLLTMAALACIHMLAWAQAPAQPVPLSEARAELLREGWLPLETYGEFPDGLRWNEDGTAGVLYRAGFTEVEACSGTDARRCSFNYVRGGKCLVLHTLGAFVAGKREPVVIRRSSICPRPELTHPAKNASP